MGVLFNDPAFFVCIYSLMVNSISSMYTSPGILLIYRRETLSEKDASFVDYLVSCGQGKVLESLNSIKSISANNRSDLKVSKNSLMKYVRLMNYIQVDCKSMLINVATSLANHLRV